MLSLSPATRVFVALAPVDMRKSFNGLYIYAQAVLQQSPTAAICLCLPTNCATA
jgi:hypothetical protein